MALNKEVVSRLLIIVVFGYPLVMATSIVISYCLPLSKPDSVAAASMLSFVLYTAYIMWAFALKTWQQLLRVSVLLLMATGLISGALMWGMQRV
ncbi:hypothetical protein [Pseudoalteromonas holothuriae]|uniref:hypothetical protein n=1 Tax=Pseudoalteromonas holothuriae TaxID=2963714 RepID=UPI0021C0194C|nr:MULTISPECIES: hypothetical protein [unclassified Pseudoalteromonas]